MLPAIGRHDQAAQHSGLTDWTECSCEVWLNVTEVFFQMFKACIYEAATSRNPTQTGLKWNDSNLSWYFIELQRNPNLVVEAAVCVTACMRVNHVFWPCVGCKHNRACAETNVLVTLRQQEKCKYDRDDLIRHDLTPSTIRMCPRSAVT